jgi:pteridine reductase
MVDKVAVITGAARRIGAELARTLHANDFNIVLHYNTSAEAATALAQELNRRRPESVALLQQDLLDCSEWDTIQDQCCSHWGRIDLLINNASSFYPTPFGTITPQQWDDLVGTNLKAPFFLSQAVAPSLKTVAGSIINIIDIHASRPLKGYSAYSIAKAGLIMLTRSLAKELAPEVRVNGIAPGAILWPESVAEIDEQTRANIIRQIPMKRQGSPEDVAATALFLATHAPYINGQIIAVDGGRSLS